MDRQSNKIIDTAGTLGLSNMEFLELSRGREGILTQIKVKTANRVFQVFDDGHVILFMDECKTVRKACSSNCCEELYNVLIEFVGNQEDLIEA